MDRVRQKISLDGEWDFAYTMQDPAEELPKSLSYEMTMPVPAYWDDYIDRLGYTVFGGRDYKINPEYLPHLAYPAGIQRPPDTSLPFLFGCGWYKKRIAVPESWRGRVVVLSIGSVTMESWLWVNGKKVGHHDGHLTEFSYEIQEYLQYGAENELVIAVSNLRTDRTGCSIRGYKGKSAGITRSVQLLVSGREAIRDCYVREISEQELQWEIALSSSGEFRLEWSVKDEEAGEVLHGTECFQGQNHVWKTSATGIRHWSDHTPKLYMLHLVLYNRDGATDSLTQSYGRRTLSADRERIYLNGQPVLLRGLTDHAYFPETCTVPTSLAYYMDRLKVLKQLGFNWIRCHTWTPPEEYMQAADRLGMMIQAEAPNGFCESEWKDIVQTCRKHPSVVLYCCGNEVALDEEMLDYVERMGRYCREKAPDCLFDPMEGLRGIEYELDETHPFYRTEPFPHIASRLEKLTEMADVLAPHGSIFSYHSLDTDDAVMEQRMSLMHRPSLMHEMGINDSFLNLDLERRYEGTRIGPGMYKAAREYLDRMGLLKNAPRYYQNSCRWMRQILKFGMENARRCQKVSGYDLLGAIDCHWHRCGYAVGILNEFYELKAGFSEEDVRRFNAESVLLADCGKERNYNSGDSLSVRMYVSLYGGQAVERAMLTWKLMDEENRSLAGGSRMLYGLQDACVNPLGELEIIMPEVAQAKHLYLRARLSSEQYELENCWDYWVFPQRKAMDIGEVRVINCLDEAAVTALERGERLTLMGSGGLPTLPTTYQIMTGGRPVGNNATVLYDHPILRGFPHQGFCDWQFYSMMQGGEAVVFEEPEIPFVPIAEIVSGYKLIRKQASLFEWQVGEGLLVVCTFRMNESDPAAVYLREQILRYAASETAPAGEKVSPETLRRLIRANRRVEADFSTDEGYDAAGHVKPKSILGI